MGHFTYGLVIRLDDIKFKSFKVDWFLVMLIIGISEASLRPKDVKCHL